MKNKREHVLLVVFAFVICLLVTQPFMEVNANSDAKESVQEGTFLSWDDVAPENILKKNAQTLTDNGARAELRKNDPPVFEEHTNMIIEEAAPGETIGDWGYTLVEKLLGEGIEVEKSSVEIKTGHIDGLGMFTQGMHATEIEEGIILSTGAVNTLPGPNEEDGTSRTLGGGSGDGDLQNLINGKYLVTETTVIEFDFIPKGRKLVFDYVFGSEEYTEFVTREFNDAFGFFINEENKPKKNIALLPDGKTPVSIHNISHLTNSKYYRNNDRNRGTFPRPGTDDQHINIELDGLTTMLTAESVVSPGKKHHIKLIVGDVADRIYDSAVFIRANSFSSKYTVAYYAGGASGDVPYAEDVFLGDPHKVLPPTGLTYKGHKFTGWLSDEPVPKLYQPGDEFKVDDTTNLTAQWEELKYNVEYDLNGGVGKTPETAEYGEDAEVTIANDNEFARPGYYFTGWKSSVDGNIYQPGIQFNIKEDVKYTAQWLGTPVISAEFDITPSVIKQTQKTAMKSTFENTGELPTEWTNVVYETSPFPVGVTPDLTTLKVNDMPYSGTVDFNPTTRVLKIVFPKVDAETIITYDAVAAADATVGNTVMSYTVKGKEGALKESNTQNLQVTQNTVTMTIKYTLENGVTPVKDINTGLAIPDRIVPDLEVGSVFNVNDYKTDISGFVYKSVENPANVEVPDNDFTVIFKYKGDLSLMKVTPTVDFGEQSLITFSHKDIWPLNPLSVDIMDTRESRIDWELSLSVKDDTFKNSKGNDFIGEVRFVDKAGDDKTLSKVPLLIQKREKEVLGKTSITWDKKNEGIYLRQLPGNTKDTYEGTLMWTLTDGL